MNTWQVPGFPPLRRGGRGVRVRRGRATENLYLFLRATIVPLLPTAKQVFASIQVTPYRSWLVPLGCATNLPPFIEAVIDPWFPTE
jgi:hypothetical protein